MPALSVESLTLLVAVALALCGALAVTVTWLAVRLHGIHRTYARLRTGGSKDEDVLTVIAHQMAAIDRLEGRLDLVGRQAAEHRQHLSTLVRSVGFHRYDAFPDTGGQLSYSAAFLDEAGDGIVLTAINGRSETRSYAKRVKGGTSAHNLSDEERTAVAMAMGATSRPVTIRLS
ncbi:MAG TPA: DUF4446 family protein [Actinomycetota bacterium]|nr:DUF4446 family protein [Actinomycetota bacterium]